MNFARLQEWHQKSQLSVVVEYNWDESVLKKIIHNEWFYVDAMNPMPFNVGHKRETRAKVRMDVCGDRYLS